MALDRTDFLDTINYIVNGMYGLKEYFESYEDFTGYMKYRPVEQLALGLE